MNDHLPPETTNQPYDVFLSHNSQDKPAVETLAIRLEDEAKLKAWLDKWNLIPGEPWQEEIERALDQSRACAVFLGPSGFGGWHHEEMRAALDQRVGDRERKFRVIPVLLPGSVMPDRGKLPSFLARLTWVDFRQGLNDEEAFRRLVAGIRGVAPGRSGSSPDPIAVECPYRGLEVFEEEHARLFFGRDAFVEAIWQKLQVRQFVAVVGPSGSGKSSVVQAGVFPRLGGEWRKLVMQPGKKPFFNLAAGLVELSGKRFRPDERYETIESLAAQIEKSGSIAAAVTETLAGLQGEAQPHRFLLVIDQFEELFTETGPQYQKAFVEALLKALQVTPVNVLVTLRADFTGQAVNLTTELSRAIQSGVVFNLPLEPDDWKAVILEPAKTVGLHVDPALVALILEEIEAQPDSLPLLEYTLKELWQRSEQNRIGLAQYEAIGKLAGAINQRADTVLAQLPAEQQSLALRALTRLVRVSGGEEEGADTRLRLPLNELSAEQRDVLQSFINERLLATNRYDRTGEETIEVAHEALIRRWEKLREAMDSDREFLVWRRRLNVRRNLWEGKGCDDKWLLAGGEHDDAQRWLNERGMELNPVEIEFITWVERPGFQIERILAEAPSLLLFSDKEILQNWFRTLVFCGEQEKALSSAREIERAADRFSALRDIAEALVKAGLTTEALAAAREIEWADARANALSFIAKALVKAGLSTEAREVAVEALAAAREVEAMAERTSTLSSIATRLAKAGLAAEALAAASEIEVADDRADALGSISNALMKAGLLVEVITAYREIAAASERSIARSWNSIAEALAKVGATAEVVREYKAASDRDDALRSNAVELAKAGQTAEAMTAAREIKAPYNRAQALKSIATELAKARLAPEALAAAREIEAADDRASALKSIAAELTKAGLAAEALAAAREISWETDRASALRDIAEMLVKADLTTEAQEVAVEALAAAREIGGTYDNEIEWAEARANALSSIAEVLVKTGLSKEALDAARESEEADVRARVLMSVADCWLEQRQIVQVESLLEEILSAIRKIHRSDKRSSAELHAAVIFARLHRYREAREFADQCHKEDRLAAYTAILREYHIERNSSLARLFAEEAAEAEEEA